MAGNHKWDSCTDSQEAASKWQETRTSSQWWRSHKEGSSLRDKALKEGDIEVKPKLMITCAINQTLNLCYQNSESEIILQAEILIWSNQPAM